MAVVVSSLTERTMEDLTPYQTKILPGPMPVPRRRNSNAKTLAAAFFGGSLVLSMPLYWNDYRIEIGKAEDLTRALSQAADEQTNGSLRTIDLLLQSVGRYVAEETPGEVGAVYNSLGLQAKAFPEVRSLLILDAEGAKVGDSTNFTGSIDLSYRNYFTYQRWLYALNKVVIDGPLLNEETGKPEIVLSRPIVTESGEFKGVVAAALSPSFFSNPLKALGPEGAGTSLLINTKGLVMLRFPESEDWIGRSIERSRLVSELLPGAPSGVYRTHGDGDSEGIDQIMAYRTLVNYPLVVAIGIPFEQVRGKFWQSVRYKLVIQFAFGGLLFYFASLLDTRNRQQLHIAEDMARLKERMAAEKALRRATEAYQDLIEGAIEGILVHSDFRALLANNSFARMFGYDSPEEIMALPSTLELIPPDLREPMRDLHKRRIRGEEVPVVYEFKGKRRDGSEIWCLNSARLVDWDGIPAVQTAFMDITAIKLAEQRQQEAKDAAEQASLSKTRFLAAASHDLRQPVQALNLYINVLSKRRHDPEVSAIIEHLRDSSTALGSLLNSLLDISKLDAGIVTPDRCAFPLGPLLDRLWAEFAPMAEKAAVSLSVVAPQHWHVESDPTLLERILQNLISNGIRYTLPGGKMLVGCRLRGDKLAIEVIDTGMGIAADQLGSIFEEFYQVENQARDRRQGLGLGLAIVRRLAGLLDHPITVRSEPGRGSRFEVVVPRSREMRRSLAAPVAASAPADGLVVVIDDEFDVRTSLTLQIGDWGYRVIAARSGKQALALLQENGDRPDVIIADYRLEDGNTGTAAVTWLRDRLNSQAPVIILTGDTAPDRLKDARASGFLVLHKPVDAEDLRRAVAEAVS